MTLALTFADGGPVDDKELARRVAGVLRVENSHALAHVEALASAGLVYSDGSQTHVTAAGRDLHGQIRETLTQITQRLWGDLPAEDLATAGRVLSTVLARADAELATA